MVFGILFLQVTVQAQYIVARDSAVNYSSSTWFAGSNEGFGFNTWELFTTNSAGHYVGQTGLGSNTFGIYSETGTGNVEQVGRALSNPMGIGTTISFELGYTGVNTSSQNNDNDAGTISVHFFNGGNLLFTLKFTGGQTYWTLNDGGSDFNTTIPWDGNNPPLVFELTRNSGNNYTVYISQNGTEYNAAKNEYTRSTSDPMAIDSIDFVSENQGNNQNFGFDYLKVEASDPGQVASGADVVIDGNITLAVGESLSVNNLTIPSGNTFTLASNSSGSASLVVSGTPSGDVTVQHYIQGGSYGWNTVSSAVAAQAVSGNWTPSGSGYDFYAYDEPNSKWLNQKESANNITTFNPGTGYLVAYQTTNPTQAFTGSLNNGDVQVSLSKQGSTTYTGANLIGNPYPSKIEWSRAFSGSPAPFADYYAYVYDPSIGDYTQVDGSSSGAFISSGQGFFVIAANDATTFTFTNSLRVANTAGKKSNAVNNDVVLSLSGNGYVNDAKIQTIGNSTVERDPYDALKFSSPNPNVPQLWSYTSNDVRVAINSLPDINSAQTIQLGIHIPADGNYSISLKDISGDFAGQQVVLKDLDNNIETNLTTDGSYSFSAVQGDRKRFVLTINGTTGIDNPTASEKALVYTVNKTIYIKAKNNEVLNGKLTVNNLLGQPVYFMNLNGTTQQTLRTNLNTGVYIVHMELNDGTTMAKKLIIQ